MFAVRLPKGASRVVPKSCWMLLLRSVDPCRSVTSYVIAAGLAHRQLVRPLARGVGLPDSAPREAGELESAIAGTSAGPGELATCSVTSRDHAVPSASWPAKWKVKSAGHARRRKRERGGGQSAVGRDRAAAEERADAEIAAIDRRRRQPWSPRPPFR